MKKIDVGREVLALHKKYIVNGEKPRMSFSELPSWILIWQPPERY